MCLHASCATRVIHSLSAVMLLVPLVAGAQRDGKSVARDCDSDLVAALAPAAAGSAWAGFLPDSTIDALAPDMLQRRWGAVLDSLAARLDRMPGLATGARDTVRAELLHLAPRLVAGGDRAAPAAHWNLVGNAYSGTYELFRGTPQVILLDDSVPADTRRAVCWTAIAVRRVLTTFNEPALRDVATRLRELSDRWDRFGASSYSQYPWELWINGKVARAGSDLEPPLHQLVVLHPAPAMELTGGRYPDWHAADVAIVELLGILRYDRSRSSFAGASGVAELSRGDRVGYGVVVHAGRVLQVGYVRRSGGGGARRGGAIIVGADLMRLLTGPPRLVGEGKRRLARAAVSCSRSVAPGSCALTGTGGGRSARPAAEAGYSARGGTVVARP